MAYWTCQGQGIVDTAFHLLPDSHPKRLPAVNTIFWAWVATPVYEGLSMGRGKLYQVKHVRGMLARKEMPPGQA